MSMNSTEVKLSTHVTLSADEKADMEGLERLLQGMGPGQILPGVHRLIERLLTPNTASPTVLCRQTHHYGFRSGKWAEVMGMEWYEEAKRPVLRVRFPDGVEDTWAIENEGIEFSKAPAPALIDNASARKVIPWEVVGQCDVEELPDVAPESHPAPWTTHDRGNGHVDVIAANSVQVAHVYLYACEDWDTLQAKLKSVNGEAE